MTTVTASTVRVDDLHAFCVDALRRLHVGEADARTTADVLVTTDTWGIFTHGIKALRGYARRLRGGGLRADARPAVVADRPAWAVVDGGSALGMVTSVLAMRTAIAKARACGIGFVGVRNSCHFGAAGYYAHLAATEGCIGLAMANDTPSVTAPGARGAVTGSNPLAYAVPTRTGRSILLDMATSTVAGGKVAAAHALGKMIPDHWAIDRDGRRTTDPADFLQGGALTPMAGHKGYGLALLIETLSGLLTGAGFTRQILRWMVDDAALPTGHGAAFLALDVEAFMPLETFFQRVDALVTEIHNAPRAPDAERVYVPGEMEWERRDRALVEGIRFPDDVLASVRGLAEEFDLDLTRIGM
ncbi:malate dehydrogenase [Planctomycetaceae bacterium SCGC AG-212-F19]|nr:malate dehydrogenase [Planctomycetaceae bacterium SCGC AG-212-F19]